MNVKINLIHKHVYNTKNIRLDLSVGEWNFIQKIFDCYREENIALYSQRKFQIQMLPRNRHQTIWCEIQYRTLCGSVLVSNTKYLQIIFSSIINMKLLSTVKHYKQITDHTHCSEFSIANVLFIPQSNSFVVKEICCRYKKKAHTIASIIVSCFVFRFDNKMVSYMNFWKVCRWFQLLLDVHFVYVTIWWPESIFRTWIGS